MLRTETAPTITDRSHAPSAGATSTLRRALVVAGDRFATPQDQMDTAELLRATGFADAARILYELAFIRAGFSRRRCDEQRAIAERTGLWPDFAVIVPASATAAPFAIDRAVADLERLMAVPLNPATSALPSALTDAVPSDDVRADRSVPDLDGTAFGALSNQLYRHLALDDADALAGVLERVRTTIVEQPEYALAAHFNADVLDLAAMVAFNGLRRFFRVNFALGWAPFGSARLFAAAARIEEGGLGPYFGNVACLIRTSRDVLGLLDLAGLCARPNYRESLERWCVLLATHLDLHDRVGLVDDLGDLGMMRGLAGLFEDARRNPDRDPYLFWAIRDAALDNGDTALGIATQRQIAALSDRNAGELVVLAEILAGTDDVQGAEDALTKAIAVAPHDRAAQVRLEALRENRFEAYRAARGFGSSKHRSAMRLRNRAERVAADAAAAANDGPSEQP